MVRSFVTMLLILAMMGPTLSSHIVLIIFELNKDYVARNLCKNRTKPELQCNGKCFLQRKLRETQDSEKNNSQKSAQKNLNFFTVEPPPTFSLEICLFSNSALELFTYYNSVYFYNNLCSVFRPPKLS